MVSTFHIIFRRSIDITNEISIKNEFETNMSMKLDDKGPGKYLSTFPIAVMKCSLHPIFIN